ncbi:SIS domain-containing protein [Pelagovum pacificum]|uniref:SIS domain-containing protein n=1 Tax=Pelagovum pacificum TaxID=2588711 RepID=A0A5C5GAL8_9RHOB|nr:SIS domain-containing protein [Pelagovum pacificum]QQA41775.1 SIS domain-containing protein [Pelagovum pacificum]TNY31048.1 SIS domain-containing protein [Pelagovum pacificum]
MSDFESFVSQAESLSELVATESPNQADRTRRILSMEEVYALRQIVLTGSGDSHIAGMAVAPVLRGLTGVPTMAMPAMEAARYLDGSLSAGRGSARGTLVIGISSSGEATRLVEAIRRLRAAGALTLGVTANAESRLGQAAERQLDISIPSAPPAPGTRSYLASLLGVLHLAIRIAEMRLAITMDVAEAMRARLTATSDDLASAFQAASKVCDAAPIDWTAVQSADVLGSGPLFASASYGAAKLVEAAGLHAVAQDAEEFHHLNYFTDQPTSVPAILYASAAGNAASRKTELLNALAQLGRPTLVIADDDAFAGTGTLIKVPQVPEYAAPILHAAPAALIAAHAAKVRGVTHYRGHTGPWAGAQGAGLVRNSKIIEEPFDQC